MVSTPMLRKTITHNYPSIIILYCNDDDDDDDDDNDDDPIIIIIIIAVVFNIIIIIIIIIICLFHDLFAATYITGLKVKWFKEWLMLLRTRHA